MIKYYGEAKVIAGTCKQSEAGAEQAELVSMRAAKEDALRTL